MGKTAASTIVYNDIVGLTLWLKYYSKWFDDLFVLGNATKPGYGELESLKEKYTFSFKRIGYLGYPQQFVTTASELQKKLLEHYEWVLWSNIDEFVVADPKKYKNIKDFMRKFKGDKCYCEGYEVFQDDDELSIDYSKPFLKQRKYWFKDNNYNKPLLSRVPLNWAEGFHRELEIPGPENQKMTDTGLYLVHLKYADPTPIGERDLGPILTKYEGRLVDEGKKNKEPIPEEIRRLF